jgi:ADP-L-glycero-D-manno-heptose 6-epimerase
MSLTVVTGGCGFIGSNIVARLAAEGGEREIVVCDHLGSAGSGKWRNLVGLAVADFVEPGDLFGWLKPRATEVEAIVHMGAISSTTEMDVDKIIANNFVFSRDIFEWCVSQGARMIWASSGATYGDGSAGFDDDNTIEALAALRPLNPYGWSKALFDLYAARARRKPPQWAGLKFFNVYGPGEGHKGEMRSVVAKIWQDVAEGRPVRLFRSCQAGVADGGQQRDFISVADVAAVIAWLTAHPGVSGIYNLGTGQARSFRELAEATFAAAGRAPQIEYVDMPEVLRSHYQYFTEARMDRLRAAGYAAPFASLEEGVADYVRTYLASEDPYR